MWKLVLREKPVSIATMTRTLAILLWATVCVGVVASNETVVIAEVSTFDSCVQISLSTSRGLKLMLAFAIINVLAYRSG